MKPTLYQYRMRPTWENGKWFNWEICSPEAAADYTRTPLLHAWEYQVRELFLKSPDVAVKEFKDALIEHFNEFPIPSTLGVVAIMKHIDKVFAEMENK